MIKQWPLWLKIELGLVISVIFILFLSAVDWHHLIMQRINLSDPTVRSAYGIAPIPPKEYRLHRVFDSAGNEVDCYQPGGDKTGACEEDNKRLQGIK